MTNKKAIEWLELMKKGYIPWSDAVMKDVYDTAIRALKKNGKAKPEEETKK